MASDWVRLDNASNIFLAAQNERDTKVFRMAATMKDKVNPRILQEALDKVYQDYPLFHSVMRRGIFWYYLEKSDREPKVRPETEPPCAPIYQSDRRNLLFRVLYHDYDIYLEVFHALTDGTGAMWFFQDLLLEYTRIRYIHEDSKRPKREKNDLEDSFKRYFDKKDEQRKETSQSLDDIFEEKEMEQQDAGEESEKPKKIYRIKGTPTPDYRPRVISVDINVKEALNLSRKEGVTLTLYMTALYLLSVYKAKPEQEEETTISVSIPINLREFFPSVSVRNFFSTTLVSYTFNEGEDHKISEICQELNRQFQQQLDKEELEKRLQRYIEFERHPLLRVLPRVVKDFILKWVNKYNNCSISVAMSNLGIANFPSEAEEFIESFSFYTSVVRPQFCMISYRDNLNITFTTPFTETDIHKIFVRHLSEEGLDVVIDVNKVTSKELEE